MHPWTLQYTYDIISLITDIKLWKLVASIENYKMSKIFAEHMIPLLQVFVVSQQAIVMLSDAKIDLKVIASKYAVKLF